MHLIGSFLFHLACRSYLFDNGMLYNLCDRSVVHCSIALCKTDVSFGCCGTGLTWQRYAVQFVRSLYCLLQYSFMKD